MSEFLTYTSTRTTMLMNTINGTIANGPFPPTRLKIIKPPRRLVNQTEKQILTKRKEKKTEEKLQLFTKIKYFVFV